jgi:hypothetical protein
VGARVAGKPVDEKHPHREAGMATKKKKAQFRRLVDEMGVPWSEAGTYETSVGGVGKNGQWEVQLGFVALDGGLYCHSVRVRPYGLLSMKSTGELPAAGITSRVLSSIKLEEIFRSLRIAERALDASAPETEPRPEQARPRSGRPPLEDKHYRKIALMYLNAMRAKPGRPIPWMAEKLRHEPSTVRGWVGEARRRGFLTPGTRGKAGAMPGPKLTGGEIKWQKTLGADAADHP